MPKRRWALLVALAVLLSCVAVWGLASWDDEDDRAPDSDGIEIGSQPEPARFEDDCLDDEDYDPRDRICYLVDAGSADYDSMFGGILALFQDDNASYQDLEALDEVTIIHYDVSGVSIENPRPESVDRDLLAYQEDTATHESIWFSFVRIIPAEHRSHVVAFAIFTDGTENTLAAVMQHDDDPFGWVLAIDIVDSTNHEQLIFTLIHEFGHLLTLNRNQVNLDPDLFYEQDDDDLYFEALAACPTYFSGEGCSEPDSYINHFYERFWIEFDEEFWELEAIEDEDEFDEALLDFYERHADHFITEYAATNVGEDIAESWTAFVLQPMPPGVTVAEQKVRFFYEFPELVELRDEIRARLYSHLRRRPAIE